MRHSMRRAFRIVFAAVPAAFLLAMPPGALADTIVDVKPFRSVTLKGGGKVTLRHAPTHRVTMIKGSGDETKISVVDGDRLVIEGDCRKGYELAVEILAPDLAGVMVADGGTIQCLGRFPHQTELDVAVEDGGLIDLRAMTADAVTARVRDGGRILTRPRETLAAKIAQGGAVTYWGHPRVTSSVEHGGVVARGAEADADKPLHEVGVYRDAVPTVPAVPPVRSKRVRGTF